MSTFYIRKGDTSTPLLVQLVNTDGGYNPCTNISSIIFTVPKLKQSGYVIQKPAVITDIPTSAVSYTWTPTDINNLSIGTYNAYFVCTYLDGSRRTYPNDGNYIQLIVS